MHTKSQSGGEVTQNSATFEKEVPPIVSSSVYSKGQEEKWQRAEGSCKE